MSCSMIAFLYLMQKLLLNGLRPNIKCLQMEITEKHIFFSEMKMEISSQHYLYLLYLFYIFYCDTSNFIFMLHLSKLLPPLWLLQNCHEIFRSNISNMKVPLITRVFVKLSTLHLHPSIHFSLSRRNYTQIKLLKRLTLITTYVFR